jgi:hypothetical protein
MHDVPPQRAVLAQHGRIDPVRDRSEPVPDPFAPRGIERDLAAARGDVELGAVGITEADPIERPQRIEARGDRPLIARHRVEQLWLRRMRVMAGDRKRLIRRDVIDHAAIGRRDGAGGALPAGHAIDRRIIHHREPQVARIMLCARNRHRAIRRDLHLVPENERERSEALAVGEAWKRDIHHDEARDEPHREQEARRNADPAMDDIEPPPPSPDQSLAHGQNFTLTDSSAVRGMPSSHCPVPFAVTA